MKGVVAVVPPPARLATPGDDTYQNVVNENGFVTSA
nr:MAG TPA: hypothetical protein [Caudoviricetes sp.]